MGQQLWKYLAAAVGTEMQLSLLLTSSIIYMLHCMEEATYYKLHQDSEVTYNTPTEIL